MGTGTGSNDSRDCFFRALVDSDDRRRFLCCFSSFDFDWLLFRLRFLDFGSLVADFLRSNTSSESEDEHAIVSVHVRITMNTCSSRERNYLQAVAVCCLLCFSYCYVVRVVVSSSKTCDLAPRHNFFLEQNFMRTF